MSQPRKRFTFSIKDVLWLTVVFSLVLGWRLHYESMEAFVKEAQNIQLLRMRVDAENRVSQLNTIRRLTDENKSLKSQLKVKVAENEYLKAIGDG